MNNYGWICPKCGRVFSPSTASCSHCGNETTFTLPAITSYSGATISSAKFSTISDIRTIKSCATCKHYRLYNNSTSCETCNVGQYPNWEAKE